MKTKGAKSKSFYLSSAVNPAGNGNPFHSWDVNVSVYSNIVLIVSLSTV